MTGIARGLLRYRPLAPRSHALNALLSALVVACLARSMAAQPVGSTIGVSAVETIMDGPSYLQHMHARILCIAECERLLYVDSASFPRSIFYTLHVYSNHSSALELSSDSSTERCVMTVNVRKNGVLFWEVDVHSPPLYQIFQVLFVFTADSDFHFSNPKYQTYVYNFEVEISSWICERHSTKVVPAAPIRIGARSAAVRWASSLLHDGSDAAQDAATSAHPPENHQEPPTHSALMVSWMMSLQRRPERWEWGRASAARAGLDVARWLVVDGRRDDARSCIDSVTAFARGLGVRSIQPYTALSAALSHKLLHRAIAEHGAFAGLSTPHQLIAGREHGPGMNSTLSCDALLAPVDLIRSVETNVDWVVIVEDDLLPNVTAADVQLVMQAMPLNFDLIWLGHCPCVWNGPAALPGEFAPVASIGISQDRVVQLWRGFASCLHAYAVNPSSTHVTSSMINLFDGVQWRSACRSEFLRCLVAVVVPFDSAEHVRSINGLPGMFEQNKELVSEIHNAPL